MANHSLPTLTSTYTNFVSELDGRLDDLAVGMDPAVTTVTNPPTGSIRWNSADKKWEKWSGTAWNELSANYAINLQGPSTVSANSTGDALRINQIGSGNALVVEDSANPDSTPFVIDANGRVIIGDRVGFSPFNYNLQHHGDGTTVGFGVTNAVDTTGAPNIRIGKSRGTKDARTAVLNGDETGALRFHGFDGVNWMPSSQIVAFVDGDPSAGAMPGRLVFSTAPSGDAAMVERMRISSSGLIDIATQSGLSIGRTAVTAPAASDGNVFSGTYTPTLTNSTNIDSSTARTCQYMRVGNVVTVSGRVTIDSTATGTASILRMSIPVSSNFAAAENGAGSFRSGGTARINAGVCYAASATDDIVFVIIPETTGADEYYFHFTYRVI